MAAPSSVTVNPSSATNATSQAASSTNTGKSFNFAPPGLPGKLPNWAILGALALAAVLLWKRRQA